MGFGAAQSLARAGLDVVGYDISVEASDVWPNPASIHREPPTAATNADVVVIMVINAEQTRAVLLGPDGAARTMKRDGVIIASATIAPDGRTSIVQRRRSDRTSVS